MRKLGIALIALLLAGSSFVLTTPAQAGSLSWHTVFKNRKAKIQACKKVVGYSAYLQQTTYDVSWRVNNRRGTRMVQFSVSTTDGGVWISGGSIPWVAPHTKKGPIGHSPEYDTSVAQISTKYGHHRKYGAVSIAAIGLC